jgi:hypothetical protein
MVAEEGHPRDRLTDMVFVFGTKQSVEGAVGAPRQLPRPRYPGVHCTAPVRAPNTCCLMKYCVAYVQAEVWEVYGC